MSRVRVWLFAAIGGALTGLISFAFLRSLDWATRTRIAHGWLVWLLPLAGLAVGAAYHYWGGRAKGGTPAVIEQSHTVTHGVTSRMAPLIVAGAEDGRVHLWDINSRAQVGVFAAAGGDEPILGLDCHPHAQAIATGAGGAQSTAVSVWLPEQ